MVPCGWMFTRIDVGLVDGSPFSNTCLRPCGGSTDWHIGGPNRLHWRHHLTGSTPTWQIDGLGCELDSSSDPKTRNLLAAIVNNKFELSCMGQPGTKQSWGYTTVYVGWALSCEKKRTKALFRQEWSQTDYKQHQLVMNGHELFWVKNTHLKDILDPL